MPGFLSALVGMAGGIVQRVSLLAASYFDEISGAGTATASVTVNSAGTATGTNGTAYQWLKSGLNSDYEIRATVQSGALSSGTAGSWLLLSTGRIWTVTRSTIGTNSATILLEIRDKTTLAVLDSAVVTLTATRSA